MKNNQFSSHVDVAYLHHIKTESQVYAYN
jgi:hypothetical protein